MRAAGVRGAEAGSGASALLDLLLDNSRGFTERRYLREGVAPRALDWAPPGVPPGRAGCALAVAFADGRLVLYAPPAGRAQAWLPAQELTAALHARYDATGWRVRARAAARRRGGAAVRG